MSLLHSLSSTNSRAKTAALQAQGRGCHWPASVNSGPEKAAVMLYGPAWPACCLPLVC